MTTTPTQSQSELQNLLNKVSTRSSPGTRRRRFIIGAVVVLVAALVLFLNGGDAPKGQYVTEAAITDNLIVTASASGTLQPTKSVDVGSELSGTLASVLVQENDRVKKGQLLAQLDTAKLKDAVTKSQAAVAAADAKIAQAVATVAETKASLARMRRVSDLSGGKVPAKTELETAEATLQRAVANETSARAEAAQARATLKTDETNLSKATIRSPVDGVVLTRKVEPGNTVVAAMNTPVLFVLAEDLTRMELQVKVDEADVSNIKPGQPANFTVSAWPGRPFPATIQRVGLGATTTDNVVTYKTILHVANDDLALRPGMTATASITTARRENVLLVPNAALRFSPPVVGTPTASGGILGSLLPHPLENPKKPTANASGQSQVWILDHNSPRAVTVKAGVSNGRYTEVVSGDLKAGTHVITDYQEAAK